MRTSESVKEIATALAAFHKEVSNVVKSANNPFFKSKYADLSAVLEAVKPALSANGLIVVQLPEGTNELTTRLLHTSGEWMEATYSMPITKANDPQALGSAISYQRRYSLMAVLSIAAVDDDDDGNAGSQAPARQQSAARPAPPTAPVPTQAQIAEGVSQLKSAATLPDLAVVWKTNKDLQKQQAFIDAKESQKAQLTPTA